MQTRRPDRRYAHNVPPYQNFVQGPNGDRNAGLVEVSSAKYSIKPGPSFCRQINLCGHYVLPTNFPINAPAAQRSMPRMKVVHEIRKRV